MNKLTSLPKNSQVLFYFFDFITLIRSVWLFSNGKMYEVTAEERKFDPSGILEDFDDPHPENSETPILVITVPVPPEMSLWVLDGKLHDSSAFTDPAEPLQTDPDPPAKPEIFYPLQVVPDPKPVKVARRKKRKAPRDVLKYFTWLSLRSLWQITLKAMYRLSWYGDIRLNAFCGNKLSHKGRYYTLGVDRLAAATGFDEATIRRHLKLMRDNNIIRRRKQGMPGIGNTVYELPFNLPHVMAWKKNPRARK